MQPPGSLCPRCSSPVPPATTGEGACPSCGLGFTSMTMTARREAIVERDAPGVPAASPAPPLGDVLAQCPFVPYELDHQWRGPRSLGGWGGPDGRVEQVTILHGDPFGGAVVRVETGLDLRWLAQGLAQVVWRESGRHAPPLAAPFSDADPTAGWDEVAIPVEGLPVRFSALAADAIWVAVAEVDPGLAVAIESTGLGAAEVGLVRTESG